VARLRLTLPFDLKDAVYGRLGGGSLCPEPMRTTHWIGPGLGLGPLCRSFTGGAAVRTRNDLSRRQMLEMTAAAGGLLLVGRFSPAGAQAARRIEAMAPELASILDTAQPIVELAKGFGGDIGPAEGPLWWKEGGYLLFNDINAARRMKYTPRQGVAVAMEKTNEANGLTRDLQGRIVSAEHLTRRVTRTEADGSITVVANSFQGKRLLRPNDVVVKSDGAMYFTDPGGPLAPDQWDVTAAGVYRVSADLGSMSLLTDEMVGPNGIAFSPDERILYVSDARQRHIKAFDMLANGVVAKQTSRVFADLGGPEPGVADGIKVDSAGNVYSGGTGGLYILDAKGKKLGRIVHGEAATTNMAFGGDDWKTLYFTTRSTLYMINLKVAGIPVPVGRKGA
jgi:gluconolactonase